MSSPLSDRAADATTGTVWPRKWIVQSWPRAGEAAAPSRRRLETKPTTSRREACMAVISTSPSDPPPGVGRPTGARDGSAAAGAAAVTVFADAVAMEAGAGAGGGTAEIGVGAAETGVGALGGTWPLGPGGTGIPGAAGSADGGAAGLAGAGHQLRREEHHQLTLLFLGEVVLEQPAEHGDLGKPGNPLFLVDEVLLAEAGDHHGSAVDHIGLGEGIPLGDDRRGDGRVADNVDPEPRP